MPKTHKILPFLICCLPVAWSTNALANGLPTTLNEFNVAQVIIEGGSSTRPSPGGTPLPRIPGSACITAGRQAGTLDRGGNCIADSSNQLFPPDFACLSGYHFDGSLKKCVPN
jgi:hypothetical protein